jgi:hypothetical protein
MISIDRGVSGYLHPAYAESFREFGQPFELPRSKGWLLRREIAGMAAADAMGCYPLFACQDWPRLHEDLEALKGSLVSVTLVTDPFGEFKPEDLHTWFTSAVPFKEHYICELSKGPEEFVSRHHRRYSRKALQNASVEFVGEPMSRLDEWTNLYGKLVRRHNLSGIKAFSRESFSKQLAVPGLIMARIMSGSEVLGALLWLIHNDVAYAHLMALTDEGYAAHAYYGLFWRSIEMFRTDFGSRISFLHLGGASGTTAGEADGMLFFKQGWSTETRQAWFCGKILNQALYDEAVKLRGSVPNGYFPLYRKGEF